MPTTTVLHIVFERELRSLNTNKVPDGGISVFPLDGSKKWGCVCATPAITRHLLDSLMGASLVVMGEIPVLNFAAGNSSAELKAVFETLGYKVIFDNDPPWA